MPAITPLTQALPYGHQNKRYKELNEAVAYFICKDGLPIYTVEKPGFEATAIIVDSNIEAEQSSSPPGCPPPAKKMKQSLGSLLKQNNTEYSELPANLSPRDKIKHEIDAYFKAQDHPVHNFI